MLSEPAKNYFIHMFSLLLPDPTTEIEGNKDYDLVLFVPSLIIPLCLFWVISEELLSREQTT